MIWTLPVTVPGLDQRSIADPDRLESCGEVAGAWLSVWGGVPLSPTTVLDEARKRWSESDVGRGTTPEVLLWAIEAATGSQLRFIEADRRELFSALGVSPGLALVRDSSAGLPDAAGPNLHWVAVIQREPELVEIMNPWGGAYEVFTPRELAAATQRLFFCDPFAIGGKMTGPQADAIAAAVVIGAYEFMRDTTPESDTAEEYWSARFASAFLAGDRAAVQGVYDALRATPEYMSAEAAMRKARAG